jgi:hypothetical protein
MKEAQWKSRRWAMKKKEISSENDSDCESDDAAWAIGVAGMESSKDLQIMLNEWQSYNPSPQGS